MAIYKNIEPKRTIMGKLSFGGDLLDELTEICKKENITLGTVAAIGAVKKAKIGFYNQQTRKYQFNEMNQYPVKGEMDFITKPRTVILPDIPIATIMVVESRPDTSTAVVISANEEFRVGTYVKGLSWVEAPDLFPQIPTCATE